METLMIARALRRNDGNRTAAAKELGINASTLFRKLKSLNIETE
jgi:transcriptional regulator with PAS, ATPase and Fis domain